MIRLGPHVFIRDEDVTETFIRADGPGGQNVNKVSTAVQLRFDAANAPGLPFGVRSRLLALAGSRATAGGEIILVAREHRTREMNRKAAMERLVALVEKAMIVPKHRRPTRATKASKERRLTGKKKRGGVKQMRGSVRLDD